MSEGGEVFSENAIKTFSEIERSCKNPHLGLIGKKWVPLSVAEQKIRELKDEIQKLTEEQNEIYAWYKEECETTEELEGCVQKAQETLNEFPHEHSDECPACEEPIIITNLKEQEEWLGRLRGVLSGKEGKTSL